MPAASFDKAFGIADFKSAFAAAARDVERLRAISRTEVVEYSDGSNHCARSLWHLTDWLFKEAVGVGKLTICGKSYGPKELARFQEFVRGESDEMVACYNICTGTKHGEVRSGVTWIEATASAVYLPSTSQMINIRAGATSEEPAAATTTTAPPLQRFDLPKLKIRNTKAVPLDVFEDALRYMGKLGEGLGFL